MRSSLKRASHFFGLRPFMTFGILLGVVAAMVLFLRNEQTINRVDVIEKQSCSEVSTEECKELLTRLIRSAGKLQKKELRRLLNITNEKLSHKDDRTHRKTVSRTDPSSSAPKTRPKSNSTPKQVAPKVVSRTPTKRVTQPQTVPTPVSPSPPTSPLSNAPIPKINKKPKKNKPNPATQVPVRKIVGNLPLKPIPPAQPLIPDKPLEQATETIKPLLKTKVELNDR